MKRKVKKAKKKIKKLSKRKVKKKKLIKKKIRKVRVKKLKKIRKKVKKVIKIKALKKPQKKRPKHEIKQKQIEIKVKENVVKCPKCDAIFELSTGVEEGRVIGCPECESDLEVVKKGKKFDVKPLEEVWEAADDIELPEWEEYEG